MKQVVSVARNYAIAFLNTFQDDMTPKDFLCIREIRDFWQDNKKIFNFLNLPGFDLLNKKEALGELLSQFKAPAFLKELIFLLVRHGRASYIPVVLAQVCDLYKERKNILFFNISSAQQLSEEELQLIERFLAYKTGKTILFDWSIDTSLIAGIRCQSDTLVWEHSISKQLDDLRKQFFLQGAT